MLRLKMVAYLQREGKKIAEILFRIDFVIKL